MHCAFEAVAGNSHGLMYIRMPHEWHSDPDPNKNLLPCTLPANSTKANQQTFTTTGNCPELIGEPSSQLTCMHWRQAAVVAKS
jgi:hypothetical protein